MLRERRSDERFFQGHIHKSGAACGERAAGVVYHYGVYRFAADRIEAQEYAGAGPIPAIGACGPKG